MGACNDVIGMVVGAARVAAVGVLLLWGGVGAARAQEPDAPAYLQAQYQLRSLSMAVAQYSYKHDGALPADLAELIDAAAAGDEALAGDRAAAFKKLLVAPGQRAPELPRDLDARAMGEKSSFVYLGRPGVQWDDLPDWGDLVVLHQRLDQGLPGQVSPRNPEGLVYGLAFVDGHTESLPRGEAERLIADSTAVLEAAATGKAFADHLQTQADLWAVIRAVQGYAKANGGELPPTLGATLPFVPKEGKRTATAAGRARVFLSPRAQRDTHVPEEPTPEWVDAHCSYAYLASGGGAKLAAVEDPRRTVLVHQKLDDPSRVAPRGGEEVDGFAIAAANGGVTLVGRPYAEWVVPMSRKVLESARTGSPLPDLAHEVRDVRLIGEAMRAYAKEHEGMAPPDLAALFEYVPAGALRTGEAWERAAVFCSPGRERVSRPPEDADAAWVRAHGSYVYLGGPGLKLIDLMRQPHVLVHAPLDEPMRELHPSLLGSEERVVAVLLGPYPQTAPLEWLEREEIEGAKRAVEELRKKR